jgi:hypothetical protein
LMNLTSSRGVSSSCSQLSSHASNEGACGRKTVQSPLDGVLHLAAILARRIFVECARRASWSKPFNRFLFLNV